MENFRYLGGGDFTGRVFCSTLEGEFVKAFGYTNGRLEGRLLVMRRSELAKHAEEDHYEHYSTIKLQEGMKTKSGTYLFDESGGAGSGYCPHGYPEGQCPYYGCNDEVVVVACPDCGAINGCFCPRCFSCGQKEKYCSCPRCVRCHQKLWECTCYQYPDPDPNPNPGGGGGSGVTPGGGSSSSMGTLSKAIFNSTSSLSSTQWKKVENALESMNNDCMGGKMVGALKGKNMTIVHDPNISANGLYNPGTNRMTIKDFKESEVSDKDLERTLFHELLHSLQTHNEDAKLNLEIEAHLAVYRYAVRKNVELFCSLFVSGIRVWRPGRFCRSSGFFFHCPAELASLRHHRSVVQKKQDDTRQCSNGLQTRTPSTDVITAWKTKYDLKSINVYTTDVFLIPYIRD